LKILVPETGDKPNIAIRIVWCWKLRLRSGTA
jgi:hypothetical protein